MAEPGKGKHQSTILRKSPKGLTLIGVLLLLCGAFIGFYLGFPHNVLEERLHSELARLPIQITVTEVSLHPLLSLKMTTPEIAFHPDAGTLQFDMGTVSPLWGSLLTGTPGLKGHFENDSGELTVELAKRGPLNIAGQGLAFNLPLPSAPGLQLGGRLAECQITTETPLQKETVSDIRITLEQTVLKGLSVLAADGKDLRLGQILLRGTGMGSTFTINQLESRNGDLLARGDGSLAFVVARPQSSRLNLNLSLRAGPQADPALANLLELVGSPQADGSRKLRLTGTLAKPVIR